MDDKSCRITRHQRIGRILWNHTGTTRYNTGNDQRRITFISIMENEILNTVRDGKRSPLNSLLYQNQLGRILGIKTEFTQKSKKEKKYDLDAHIEIKEEGQPLLALPLYFKLYTEVISLCPRW